MTPIERPGDLPDNLPLLTQVVDGDAPDDLPTLTEVVAEVQAESASGLQPDADREIPAPENETSHVHFPLPNPDGTTGETTSHPTKQPEDGCQVVGYSHSTKPASGQVAGYLPQAGEGANESLRELHVNEEELQRLLRRLEIHLENMFAHKLSVNLEQLQRQAIEQAVSELKAELPELLRNALKAHPEL